MSPSATPSSASYFLVIALSVGACGKVKENKPAETAQTRAEAKRHKDACASSTAYGRMKRVIFDQAREQSSHRTNLDTLEAFSIVRMEEPVVEGWDPELDVTRCRGRIILDVPPGSEQALGGKRRLAADIAYTAQGAADASGLVYAVTGAAPTSANSLRSTWSTPHTGRFRRSIRKAQRRILQAQMSYQPMIRVEFRPTMRAQATKTVRMRM